MPLKAILGALVMLFLLAAPARAQDGFADLLSRLDTKDRAAQARTVEALATTGDPRAGPVLEALSAGDLYARKSDGQVFVGIRDRRELTLTDPLTNADAGVVSTREMNKIRANNTLRRAIGVALGALALADPDPDARAAAAREMRRNADAGAIPLLDRALAAETDPAAAAAMRLTRAAITIRAPDAAAAERLAAVGQLGEAGGREALALLAQVPDDAPEALRTAAAAERERIEGTLRLWDMGQNVWYGLSLGSVLLLAAIGLAITFGVMGVINMAHGELVMIGAYATFTVQEIIRTHAPFLFDWSLLIAAPLAFLVSGLVGVMIERGVVRHLYGRPLETLLATWGVSLILQQAVRSIYGPTNQEVGNPAWMSGAMQVGELTITMNRLWILVFALVVFAGLLIVLRRTQFGLEMRAVTQNRPMAAEMGIRTARVDALTFGLGAGVAGLAGVALSQIDNVSPNLGQGYIVDSFMVVVFGGAGNLWGALAGAFTLGVANKFMEPFAGAVLAKVLILVLIILFIQKRPRGLFAVKGRSVEG